MTEAKLDRLPFERSRSKLHLEKLDHASKRVKPAWSGRDEPSRNRRKLPQPCRDRHASAQHVRLM